MALGAPGPEADTLHASAVAVDGRGVLILGGAGSGKSALALELIARGAALVADDRTHVTRRDGALHGAAPAPIAGLIEARFVGILGPMPARAAQLALAVDLDRTETARLPPARTTTLLGLTLPCLRKAEGGHFPAAILLYLSRGRAE